MRRARRERRRRASTARAISPRSCGNRGEPTTLCSVRLRAAKLRVLLPPDDRQVQRNQRPRSWPAREDVRRRTAADRLVAGTETLRRAAEMIAMCRQPESRAAPRSAIRSPIPLSRSSGKRIAGEALEKRQQKEQHADHPVDFARIAKGAGEKDAPHVNGDSGDENERRPMMDLPDQQTRIDREAQVQRRRVGRATSSRRRAGDRVHGKPSWSARGRR